jgi:sugar-specific transcriptional regulator TrmB
MKIIQKLIYAGMHPKEAKIYAQLLPLGTQPASVIAKKIGTPRSTTSLYLEELSKKGLVAKSKKGNSFVYFVESPQALVEYLEHKKLTQDALVDKQIQQAKNLLPELQSFHGNSPTRPKISFYEGKEGLMKVYEDTLTSSENLRSFASVDNMHKTLPGYFPEYYKRRTEKGISIRSVHPDTPVARERVTRDAEESRESALISSKKYHFTPEIQFYDGKVNIASWKEKLGIIIESQEIYEAFVVMFELAFLEAKKKNTPPV